MNGSKKILALSRKTQHKQAAQLLRFFITSTGAQAKMYFARYQAFEHALHLPPVESTFEALSNRFHFHLNESAVSLSEENFLSLSRTPDHLDSTTPFLPITIYLDHLRSSHNVGSIVRTTEALRLGTIVFSAQTPDHNHPKVQKRAMGASLYVPAKKASLEACPHPFIALETLAHARPYYDVTFPQHPFTLLLGNEEYGLSHKALQHADQVISIPLVGAKNSLNVACAFAIIAAEIRRQASS